nr:hypothetical protein [uncultured Desulfobacter sp.]
MAIDQLSLYCAPTFFIDSDHEDIIEFSSRHTGPSGICRCKKSFDHAQAQGKNGHGCFESDGISGDFDAEAKALRNAESC